MSIQWEKFPGRVQSYATRASLRTGGAIGFSDGAVLMYHMRKYDGAVLHADKDRTRIGIELVNGKPGPEVVKLVHRKGDTYISAKSFMQWSRIPFVTETQRFELQRDVESGYLVIELNNPIPKRGRGQA